MGKVNVVLPDGRVVAVDEADAKAMSGTATGDTGRIAAPQETVDYNQAQDEAQIQHQVYGGVKGTVLSAAGGALDALTLGAGTRALGADDAYRKAVAEHPIANVAGSLGGVVLPGMGEIGTVYDAIKGGSEALGLGTTAARAVEGAAYGGGGYVAKSNVTGDPLTIEGFAEDAGIGSLLNVGLGAMGDGRTSVGKRMTGRAAEQEVEFAKVKDLGERAQKGGELLSRTPDSYNEFRSFQGAQDAAATTKWKATEKANNDWEDFLGSTSDFGDVRDKFNEAQNEIREKYVQPKKAGDLIASNAKLTNAIDRAQEVVDELEDRVAPKAPAAATKGGYPGQTPEPTPAAEGKGLKGLVDQEAVQPGDNETALRLKGYRAQISQAYQVKGGGWANQAGKWVRVEDAPANPAGALEILRGVQQDMMTRYPKASGWLRDLPDALPKGVTPEQAQLTKQLLDGTQRDMQHAEGLWRGGDKEQALDLLRGTGQRINGVYPDVAVPDLPTKPLDRYARPIPTKLPAKLEDFARMQAPTIQRLADAIKESGGAYDGQVQRLAADLGVKLGPDAGITLASIHGALSSYAGAVDELAAKARASAMEAAAAKGSPSNYLATAARWAKRGAAYGIGRIIANGVAHAVGMPWLGWFARGATTAMAGSAIEGVGEALNGSLMAGKQGISTKLEKLVGRYATGTGAGLRALGPVTAYLRASFPGGQRDPETDLTKLATNRIRDLQAAALNVHDAGYAAVDHLNMLGHPNDVGLKLQQHLVNVVQHLAANAPRDPGLDHHITGSDWRASLNAVMEFAHRMEAALNPIAAMARMLGGDSHPAAADTLHQCWPALSQRGVEELALHADDLGSLTYEHSDGHSMLAGGPMSSLQEPLIINQLQGLYLPPQQSQATGPGRAGFGRSPRAVGRPAAVQSPVAGSSPGNLTQ